MDQKVKKLVVGGGVNVLWRAHGRVLDVCLVYLRCPADVVVCVVCLRCVCVVCVVCLCCVSCVVSVSVSVSVLFFVALCLCEAHNKNTHGHKKKTSLHDTLVLSKSRNLAVFKEKIACFSFTVQISFAPKSRNSLHDFNININAQK